MAILFVRSACALALVLICSPFNLGFAQTTAAFVHGRVLDPAGGSVPAATVTVRGPAGQRSVTTNERGEFAVPNLADGEYEVLAEAQGFAAAADKVAVAGSRGTWLELSLALATISEAVRVTSDSITGSATRAARIPGSIDVIDRRTLDQSNVFTVNEALRKVSGVHARDEEGLGLRPNIGIRGANPTRSSRVLLLEDGIPLTYAPYGDNASYYHPPVDRFESIEILKGAGQIAYGPMTVGGVINYITPLPPVRPRGQITVAAGSRDYVNAQGAFGATVGRTGYSLDFMRKQSDGARDNVSSGLNDVNGKVVITLSSSQRLTARGNYFSEDSNITYSGLREDEWRANPRGNVFVNDYFYVDRGGASATHLWAPSANAVLGTTVYGSVFRRHWWRQSSNSSQRPNDASDPACGGMENLSTSCGNEGRLRLYHVIGAEPRLSTIHNMFGIEAESDIGVRVHHERQDRVQRNGDFPTARTGPVVEDNERLNTALSGFIQQRLRLGAWTITPGIRLEHILYTRSNRLRGVSGDTALTEAIPGIGIAHAPRAGVTWFAGIHRGFAPPRTEDLINNNTGGVVDLDPESSWNFELGARTELIRGLNVDTTFFRTDYENQVIPASVAGGIGATLTNAGETLHQGLEASARVDTVALLGGSHNVSVRSAFTWLPVARFQGTRFSSIPGFQTVLISGNRLPYAPEHLATVGVGYAVTDRFDAAIEAVHVSDQFGDDLETVQGTPDGQRGLLPGHLTWNASANYRLPKYDARLFITVKNLTDRLYIADRSRGLLPGIPRLVHVGVKLEF